MKNLDLTKLSKQKFDILKTCYYGLLIAEDELINKATKTITEDALEETCEVPQSIENIRIENTSISTELFINGKSCVDPNIEW